MNLILNSDSYKLSHYKMYPPGMTEMTSYIEPRPGGKWNNVVFFGLQMFLKEYLMKPIAIADIIEAKSVAAQHGEPFNEDGWLTIVHEYDGYLPLEIQAIPEGTVVRTGTPVVQFRNTDPRFAWLPAYIETSILRAVWYPCTVATHSLMCKELIEKYLFHTGCVNVYETANFMLHDFGARGATSHESAGIGSAAHQMFFMGTDTIEGILVLQNYYSAEVVSFSIPAMDHSTVTTWGEEYEYDAYANTLNTYLAKDKIVACVIDSYDTNRAVDTFCTKFKDIIINSGGRCVLRPDSGNPIELCTSIVSRLMESFGYTTNDKGFKVLPNCIRVLFGDGIDINSLEQILKNASFNKIAAENFVFGMGGGLLQGVTRDTLRFACKTNAAIINGVNHDVFKRTPGKESKSGRMAVDADTLEVCKEINLIGDNLLEVVFRNGKLLKEYKFSDIRKC